jgi:hypothetical protein
MVTRAHIARARELRETIAPTLAQSAALVARSRELCRVFRRRISGGSDLEAPVAITRNEAIWRFLEAHRGDMFCTQCIAAALFATKRIDRAILGAEGRGALRRYGTCVKCGKDRLLCGLAR